MAVPSSLTEASTAHAGFQRRRRKARWSEGERSHPWIVGVIAVPSFPPHRAAGRSLAYRRNETVFHGARSGDRGGRKGFSPSRGRPNKKGEGTNLLLLAGKKSGSLLPLLLLFFRLTSSFLLVAGCCSFIARDWREDEKEVDPPPSPSSVPGQASLRPLSSPSSNPVGSPRNTH